MDWTLGHRNESEGNTTSGVLCIVSDGETTFTCMACLTLGGDQCMKIRAHLNVG